MKPRTLSVLLIRRCGWLEKGMNVHRLLKHISQVSCSKAGYLTCIVPVKHRNRETGRKKLWFLEPVEVATALVFTNPVLLQV